ncbi:hypothetical protein [Sulfodiicoccus acidiphilus]|nr:hypothetical protein [Sulfodiicoccus acidiphilus]
MIVFTALKRSLYLFCREAIPSLAVLITLTVLIIEVNVVYC